MDAPLARMMHLEDVIMLFLQFRELQHLSHMCLAQQGPVHRSAARGAGWEGLRSNAWMENHR